MKTLQIINYKLYYKTLRGYIKAVDGVDLEINNGEILGIIGESGCGKSTLAQSIILPGYPMMHISGNIILSEKYDLTKLNQTERRSLLLIELSYIPQFAIDALPVIKKIRAFLKDLITDKRIPIEQIEPIIKERFKQVNLPERVLDMYPLELSGGMRQRVVIAISTLFKPSLLIADEPTSALDVVTQRQVLELLRDLRDQKVVGSLMVISHDIAAIRQISDRIATMYAGKIVEIGPLEETIKQPLHPYTSSLIKAVPPVDASYKKNKLTGLSGSPPSLLDPPQGCRFHPRCPHAKQICFQQEPPMAKIDKSYVACWLYG
ncbi:MAG: ABC transporter ATP-binding protein [Desulfurococcaceae archaeon]